MGKESITLSQVVPLLIAVLVCDVANTEPTSGKTNLIGIFDIIHVNRFPTQRPRSLYAKVADVQGYYKTEIRYVQTSSGNILAKAEGELKTSGGPVSKDIYMAFLQKG